MAVAASLAVLGMAWQWCRAEANLAEATRQQKRFRVALNSSGRVTASILNLLVTTDEAGSIDEQAHFESAREEMARHTAVIRNDPDSLASLALAYNQTSILLCKAGRRGPAIEALRQGIASWGALVALHPNDPFALCSQAAATCYLAEQYRADLPPDERTRLLGRAVELYQAAAAVISGRRPVPGALRAEFSRHYHDSSRVGQLAENLGRRDEAIAGYREALACLQVAEPAPADRLARSCYVSVHSHLAKLRCEAGQGAAAIPHLSAGRDLRAEELRTRPEDPVARQGLARACFRLGIARRDAGQLDEALVDLRRARTLWEASPHATRRRLKELARIAVEIGRIEDRQGRFAAAILSFIRAKERFESLARQVPDDVGVRRDLAMCYHVIGNLHRDLRQLAEAAASFRQALMLREALARDFPDNAQFASSLNGTRRNLAEVSDLLAGR
jgi:tetratricopeptide (TPR) repeat protein